MGGLGGNLYFRGSKNDVAAESFRGSKNDVAAESGDTAGATVSPGPLPVAVALHRDTIASALHTNGGKVHVQTA